MSVSVRRHADVNAADFGAINRIIRDTYVPVLQQAPGLVLYALGNCSPDVVPVLNVFRSEAEVLASNEQAAHGLAAP